MLQGYQLQMKIAFQIHFPQRITDTSPGIRNQPIRNNNILLLFNLISYFKLVGNIEIMYP